MGEAFPREIVVSAVNIRKGGTLTVLRNCLEYLSGLEGLRVIALVHKRELCEFPGVEYVELPWTVKSWGLRLWCEYVTMYGISRRFERELGRPVDVWLSMHDTTPRVVATRREVYCHTSFPFMRRRLRDVWMDPKVFLFSVFTRFAYRVNVKQNDWIIVQQEWFRDAMSRMLGVERGRFRVIPPEVKVPGSSPRMTVVGEKVPGSSPRMTEGGEEVLVSSTRMTEESTRMTEESTRERGEEVLVSSTRMTEESTRMTEDSTRERGEEVLVSSTRMTEDSTRMTEGGLTNTSSSCLTNTSSSCLTNTSSSGLTRGSHKFGFLYASSGDCHKNFETLLRAAAKLEKELGPEAFRVIITITGTENRYTRWLHRRWGKLSTVEFAGFLPKDELYARYAAADCLVFPSRIETWGLPITEYMAVSDGSLILADLPYAHESAAAGRQIPERKISYFPPENADLLAGAMASAMKQLLYENTPTR